MTPPATHDCDRFRALQLVDGRIYACVVCQRVWSEAEIAALRRDHVVEYYDPLHQPTRTP